MKKVILGTAAIMLIAGFAYGHSNEIFRNGGHHMFGAGNHMQTGMYMHGPDGAAAHGAMSYGGCQGFGNYETGMRHDREFLDATASLRREMHNKRFELSEASRNQATSAGELARLEKEIIDLRTKIHDLNSADTAR